jgi:hypothetical protein
MADCQALHVRMGIESPDEDHFCATCCDKVTRLFILIEGLDSWLTKGGFLPAKWVKNRRSLT